MSPTHILWQSPLSPLSLEPLPLYFAPFQQRAVAQSIPSEDPETPLLLTRVELTGQKCWCYVDLRNCLELEKRLSVLIIILKASKWKQLYFFTQRSWSVSSDPGTMLDVAWFCANCPGSPPPVPGWHHLTHFILAIILSGCNSSTTDAPKQDHRFMQPFNTNLMLLKF